MTETEVKTKAPSRAELEKKDRKRRQEIDGSLRGKLGIDISQLDTKNFHYRWVENSPERLAQATVNDDYYFVTHDDIHATNGNDSYVRRNGGEHGMVLTRKLKEHFVEDQKAKARELDGKDRFIRKGGNTARDLGDKGYVPEEAKTSSKSFRPTKSMKFVK